MAGRREGEGKRREEENGREEKNKISQIEYANHKRENSVISENVLQWLSKLFWNYFLQLIINTFANKPKKLWKKRVLSQYVNVPFSVITNNNCSLLVLF